MLLASADTAGTVRVGMFSLGNAAAMAARLPAWFGSTDALPTIFSVPLMSAELLLRATLARSARTCTASSTAAARASLTSATRISSSARRFSSNRRATKPMAEMFTQ